MSAAYVSCRDGGPAKPLDEKQASQTTVSPEDAANVTWLARLLTRLLDDVSELKRRFAPDRITFRDIVATGSGGAPQRITLAHNLGQLVEWWPVRMVGLTSTTYPIVEISQDANTLVLDIYFTAPNVWIRVEAAG